MRMVFSFLCLCQVEGYSRTAMFMSVMDINVFGNVSIPPYVAFVNTRKSERGAVVSNEKRRIIRSEAVQARQQDRCARLSAVSNSNRNRNKKERNKAQRNGVKEYRKKHSSQDVEKTVVILYHKPKGVITSHSNHDAVSSSSANTDRRTVYEDIQSMEGYTSTSTSTSTTTNSTLSSSGAIPVPTTHIMTTKERLKLFEETTGIKSKLHAIGRLDADTTGLLLLTNDGQLVHHVTNPTASSSEQKKLIKVYDALIMGHHTLDLDHPDDGDEDLHQSESESSISSKQPSLRTLLRGVDIGKKYGGMTQPPHELRVLGHPSPKSTLVRIAISEGKNRQVRRMFHAINSGVMKLHRQRIGDIDLDMMNEGCRMEGQWRLLTDAEIMQGLGWKVRRLDSSERGSATKERVEGRAPSNHGRKRRRSSRRRRS